MPLATLNGRGPNLEDVLSSGDGALLAGMKDRRTFKAWAKKLKIDPYVRNVSDGRESYLKKDADRVAKAYKAFLESKKKGG